MKNESHLSSTDPDCTMLSSARAPLRNRLYYKGHYSIDGNSRVITDIHATTGALHESQVLASRIEYQSGRFDLPIRELIADSAYGKGETYAFCRERKIRTYIPLHEVGKGRSYVRKEGFSYDGRRDCYWCPQGHILKPFEKPGARGIRRYRILGKTCSQCPIRQKCLSRAAHRKRIINRSPYQNELDQVRRRQSTEYFKSKLKQRS